jgi:hypothetical protein
VADHSYGAFVVLQQAVDSPGRAAATIKENPYAQENEAYLEAVRRFLQSVP